MDRLHAFPISQKEAFAFIAAHHRHHRPPQGTKFQVAVCRQEIVVGVATCGRPVSRMLDNGMTLEITRLCTLDDTLAEHAASKLYAMCRTIGETMGYQRIITYTLASELGVSLRAAGYVPIRFTDGGTWSRPSRLREDTAPLDIKQLWYARNY